MGVRHVRLGSVSQPREMSEPERAYFGAMIDGEGSIAISRTSLAGQNEPQYRLIVSVANTNFELLQSLQRMIGLGGMSRRNRETDKWKDAGQLCLNHEAAAYCLQQITPFLIIKAKQADIALRFMQLKREWSRSNDNRAEQAACYEQMRALNARGKAAQIDYQFEAPPKRQRTCEQPGCDAVHYGNGMCRRHYRWAYESKTWSPETTRRCAHCDEPLPPTSQVTAKFCSTACKMKWHRRSGCYSDEAKAGARPCSVEGCDRPHHSGGMCRRHYMQQWHAGRKTAAPSHFAPDRVASPHR